MKSLAVKKLFEIGCFYAGQKRFFKTFFYQRVFESLDFDLAHLFGDLSQSENKFEIKSP